MNKSVVENTKDALLKASKQFEDDTTLQQFEKALLDFEKMVADGLVKKRGYTLQTIDRMYIPDGCFNVGP